MSRADEIDMKTKEVDLEGSKFNMTETLSTSMASVTAGLLISTVVICLNSISLFVILRDRRMRQQPSTKFIISLAVVDLGFALYTILVNVFQLLDMYKKFFFICSSLHGFVFPALYMSSLLFTFINSIDRYIFMKMSIKYEIIMSPRRVKVIVFGFWFFSSIFGLFPMVIGTPVWKYRTCDEYLHSRVRVFGHYPLLIIAFAIILVVTDGLYVSLFREIRKRQRETSSLQVWSSGDAGITPPPLSDIRKKSISRENLNKHGLDSSRKGTAEKTEHPVDLQHSHLGEFREEVAGEKDHTYLSTLDEETSLMICKGNKQIFMTSSHPCNSPTGLADISLTNTRGMGFSQCVDQFHIKKPCTRVDQDKLVTVRLCKGTHLKVHKSASTNSSSILSAEVPLRLGTELAPCTNQSQLNRVCECGDHCQREDIDSLSRNHKDFQIGLDKPASTHNTYNIAIDTSYARTRNVALFGDESKSANIHVYDDVDKTKTLELQEQFLFRRCTYPFCLKTHTASSSDLSLVIRGKTYAGLFPYLTSPQRESWFGVQRSCVAASYHDQNTPLTATDNLTDGHLAGNSTKYATQRSASFPPTSKSFPKSSSDTALNDINSMGQRENHPPTSCSVAPTAQTTTTLVQRISESLSLPQPKSSSSSSPSPPSHALLQQLPSNSNTTLNINDHQSDSNHVPSPTAWTTSTSTTPLLIEGASEEPLAIPPPPGTVTTVRPPSISLPSSSRHSSTAVRKPRKHAFSSKDLRTAKLLIFIFGVYNTLWSPAIVVVTLMMFGVQVERSILRIAYSIGMINSVFNFFVYPMKVPGFRRAIKRIFRCCWRFKQKTAGSFYCN